MRKCHFLLLFCLAATIALSAAISGQYESDDSASSSLGNTSNASDIVVPQGYQVSQIAGGLAGPIGIAWDDQDRMIIAEAGVIGSPEVSRIEEDGTKTVLANATDFGDEIPVTAVAVYNGTIYVAHRGQISQIDENGGNESIDGNDSNATRLVPVITGLPGNGDHQTNQLVFKDGWMYLSVGTVTNSGVVGPDNIGWLRQYPNLQDVPCEDITLTDNNIFPSANPLLNDQNENTTETNITGNATNATNVIPDYSTSGTTVQTSPFHRFGETAPAGSTVEGSVKCNGAVLRAMPDGSELSVVAWGMRNPFGLVDGPDDSLYFTNNGPDERGSRPIANASDCLYELQNGSWYGWPDFVCGEAVTLEKFRSSRSNNTLGFIIANHPTESPPAPIARYTPHSAATGFDFGPESWGDTSDAYIAEQGDLAPATANLSEPVGFRIVKTDTETGNTTDFAYNPGKVGPAAAYNMTGFNRPVGVFFHDDIMYVTDFGVFNPDLTQNNSGVIWKIAKTSENLTNITDQTNISMVQATAGFFGNIGSILINNINNRPVQVMVQGPNEYFNTLVLQANAQSVIQNLITGNYIVTTTGVPGNVSLSIEPQVCENETIACDNQTLLPVTADLSCLGKDSSLTMSNPNNVPVRVVIRGPASYRNNLTLAGGQSLEIEDVHNGNYRITTLDMNNNQISSEKVKTVNCEKCPQSDRINTTLFVKKPYPKEGNQFTFVCSDPEEFNTEHVIWDFGDGETIAGPAEAYHEYDMPGNYTVRCIATDAVDVAFGTLQIISG